MKFNLTDPQPAAPKLSDVKINQFFVTTDDKLCQKVTHESYNVIAYCADKAAALAWPGSVLMASCTQTAEASMPIKRVCPHVQSIDF